MPIPDHPTPDTLPDPWLFDSEKLLRELDRIREMVLLVPNNGDKHATHFALTNAVTSIWTLRDTLNHLIHLHKDGQRRFAALHPPIDDTNAKERREQERVDLLRKEGAMRPDYETALERRARQQRNKRRTSQSN